MKHLFKKIMYILFKISFYEAIGFVYEKCPYRFTIFAICPISLKMKFDTQNCTEDEEHLIDEKINEFSKGDRYIIVFTDRDYDTDYTYNKIVSYIEKF